MGNITGIANLTMYDLPEVAAANDALWAGIARALGREGLDDVPAALTGGVDLGELWRSPGLLFSQTCGYPLVYGFEDALELVATPVYDAPGCEGPDYGSMIVVREADPARDLSDLRVLARSPAAPGLPYVTRAGAGDDLVARLRRALFAALDDPNLASARDALLLAGAEVLSRSAYQRILDLEERAESLGYAEVA